MTYQQITDLLGKENENLFTYECKKVPKESLHLPSPHFIEDIFSKPVCDVIYSYDEERLTKQESSI